MNKKIVYLFLALLLPGLIFVFLKYFGKNEFDIPVYYTEGIKDVSGDCKLKSEGQYYVPDSVLIKMNWRTGVMLILQATDKERTELNQLISNSNFENLQLNYLNEGDSKIKNCILLMKDPWNAVLIDEQKRIRGYYKLGHRDDMDRLEVELKILLKKY